MTKVMRAHKRHLTELCVGIVFPPVANCVKHSSQTATGQFSGIS